MSSMYFRSWIHSVCPTQSLSWWKVYIWVSLWYSMYRGRGHCAFLWGRERTFCAKWRYGNTFWNRGLLKFWGFPGWLRFKQRKVRTLEEKSPGWSMSDCGFPQKNMSESNQNLRMCDLIWRQVLCRNDWIKVRALAWLLIPYNWCPHERRKFETDH